MHVVLAGGADATDSALCEVTLHEQNKLVVIGDRVRKVSRYGAGDEYPGRVDLQWNDSRRVSARYKRLAWFGAAGLVNGHPLAKGEFLLDPIGALQYGVTSRLTAFTVPGLNALGMAAALALFEQAWGADDPRMTGECRSTPELLEDGRLRLHERWRWTSGDGSEGESLVEEVPRD